MRKVIVSEFLTLDGVMDDPGGAEGLPGGGWAFRFERGPEGDKFKLDEVMGAEAMLLGRKTYEGFAQAWPGRTDECCSAPATGSSATARRPRCAWSRASPSATMAC